jgi:ABC-type uncharacterized transport system permease subunit
MDRIALLGSTLCFLAGFALSVQALRARALGGSPGILWANLCGFLFQTVWLYQRGQQAGRCPLTSLFDVLVFLGWSVALLYLLAGATYRLSLLGVFTSPLVFLLQTIALLMPMPELLKPVAPVNPWLELHAAISVVAYGAFALAGVAGVTLLVQERQLKTRVLHSFFYRFPSIHDLAAANRRLVYIGFILLTVGLLSGFSRGVAHIGLLRIVSVAVWLLYGFLCAALGSRRISPQRAAWLAVGAFLVLLTTVWAVQIVSKG